MRQNDHIYIITPVYNDWECFGILHREIREVFADMPQSYTLLAVNDGSTVTIPPHFEWIAAVEEPYTAEPAPGDVLVLDLQRNLGHQKAITCGISFVDRYLKPDYVIVMDSDGEDRPSDIPALIGADADGSRIVFAQRRSRQESRLFRYMYRVYKIVFRLLSGYVISFGNFVLLPREQLSRLVYISEIWNHFPGGIMRSRLPYISVPIDRGRRYRGRSKMSMVALVQHGISSITVNTDIVSVRLLLFSVFLMIVTFVLFCGLIGIRLFSDYAIPGWTSSIAVGLLMILLQSFFFSLLLTFMVLNARVQRNFIPALDFKDYVRSLTQYRIHD